MTQDLARIFNMIYCPVGESMQCTGTSTDCNGTVSYPTFDWSSTDTTVMTVDSSGVVTGVAAGSATIIAQFASSVIVNTGQICSSGSPSCQQGTPAGSSPADVDSLVYTITSGGVPNDSQGVVAKQAFNLQIQAKTSSGVVPDTNFTTGGISFQLQNINASVGESAPSTVSFSSGTANANVTIVQASGSTSAPSSVRTIVLGVYASDTVFFPEVYWEVTADLECWKNPNFAGCSYDTNGCAVPNGSYYCTAASGCGPGCTSTNKNQPQGYSTQTAFMTLPYAGMCPTGVVVEANAGSGWSPLTSTSVGDIGPNSTTDDYWFTGSIPSLGSCLSDLLASQMNLSGFSCTTGSGSATILWRFAQ